MNSYLKLLRPRQWVKNIFVLAPLFFALRFVDVESWMLGLTALFSFICISSAIYIINDICDIKLDSKHPKKKLRPLVTGEITLPQAYLTASILLLIGGIISLLFLPMECLWTLLSYILLQLVYSIKLKQIAILDVLLIASGFVLRVLMGGAAIYVPVSSWMLLAIFLLMMFIGFSKRYHEILLNPKKDSRKSLDNYSKKFLEQLISVSCCATLICYMLYVRDMVARSGKESLYITVIFVTFGLLRYLQHVFVDDGGGEPEEVIYSDKIFICNGLLWLVTILWILSIGVL